MEYPYEGVFNQLLHEYKMTTGSQVKNKVEIITFQFEPRWNMVHSILQASENTSGLRGPD